LISLLIIIDELKCFKFDKKLKLRFYFVRYAEDKFLLLFLLNKFMKNWWQWKHFINQTYCLLIQTYLKGNFQPKFHVSHKPKPIHHLNMTFFLLNFNAIIIIWKSMEKLSEKHFSLLNLLVPNLPSCSDRFKVNCENLVLEKSF